MMLIVGEQNIGAAESTHSTILRLIVYRTVPRNPGNLNKKVNLWSPKPTNRSFGNVSMGDGNMHAAKGWKKIVHQQGLLKRIFCYLNIH